MELKERFNDSVWWHEHVHFADNFIIKEDFTRDDKGRVIAIDYVVLDNKGRFITISKLYDILRYFTLRRTNAHVLKRQCNVEHAKKMTKTPRALIL